MKFIQSLTTKNASGFIPRNYVQVAVWFQYDKCGQQVAFMQWLLQQQQKTFLRQLPEITEMLDFNLWF